MNHTSLNATATYLAQACLGGPATELPPAHLVPGDLAEAYLVQAALGEHLTDGACGR